MLLCVCGLDSTYRWIVVSFSFSASMSNPLFSPAVPSHGHFVLFELCASVSGFAYSMLYFSLLYGIWQNIYYSLNFFVFVMFTTKGLLVFLVELCEVMWLLGYWSQSFKGQFNPKYGYKFFHFFWWEFA